MREFHLIEVDLSLSISVVNGNPVNDILNEVALGIFNIYRDILNRQSGLVYGVLTKRVNENSDVTEPFKCSVTTEEFAREFVITDRIYREILEKQNQLAEVSKFFLTFVNDNVLLKLASDTTYIWIRNDEDGTLFPFSLQSWPRCPETGAIYLGGFKPGTWFYVDDHWLGL